VNDLNVQSARLIDIILEMEDKFAIRIDDEEAGALTTVGSAVDLLIAKLGEKEAAAA
jgi:acyl carrier protein